MNNARKDDSMKKTVVTAVVLAAASFGFSSASIAAESQEPYTAYVVYTGDVIADVNGITQRTKGAVVARLDGTTETCATIFDKSATLGSVVTVSTSAFGQSLTLASGRSVSGTVNAQSMRIGSTPVSENVQILDIAAQPIKNNHDYAAVSLDRIDGLTLDSNDIKYCATDANGYITELVLNDVTGDSYTYGIVTDTDSDKDVFVTADGSIWHPYGISSSSQRYSPVRLASSYRYDIDMDTHEGKLVHHDDSYDTFSFISPLYRIGNASSLSEGTATVSGSTYKLSDSTAIYYTDNSHYVQTSLESVSDGNYTLTCYYDKPESQGGRIRIIVAEHK